MACLNMARLGLDGSKRSSSLIANGGGSFGSNSSATLDTGLLRIRFKPTTCLFCCRSERSLLVLDHRQVFSRATQKLVLFTTMRIS